MDRSAVWLVTFALTVLADLTVAVEAGMILAALLFIRRVAATTTVSRVTPDYISRGHEHSLQDRDDSRLRRRSTASTGRSCSAPPTSWRTCWRTWTSCGRW